MARYTRTIANATWRRIGEHAGLVKVGIEVRLLRERVRKLLEESRIVDGLNIHEVKDLTECSGPAIAAGTAGTHVELSGM